MRGGLFSAVAAVAALAVVSSADARQATTTVQVTAREFSFVVSPARPKHGRITFVIVNKGKMSARSTGMRSSAGKAFCR